MTLREPGESLPRVSVLMTIYNAEPYLRESINSLLSQSFADWELIAVENGSTDGSPAILGACSDARIRVFGFPENIGRTPALRYALDQARAEYVAVLDADDIAHPERFAKQVRFLDRHAEAALVGSWAHLIDSLGAVFDSWEPPAAATELLECFGWVNPIINSSVMYRRAEALAAGGYPSDLHYGQDLALIMNLTAEGQLAIIPEHLCQLRVVGGRMSNARRLRLAVNEEKLRLLRAASTQLPLRTDTLRRNRRAIAFAEMRYGVALVRALSISRGAKLILRGLRRDPSALWRNSIVRRRLGYGEFGGRFLTL